MQTSTLRVTMLSLFVSAFVDVPAGVAEENQVRGETAAESMIKPREFDPTKKYPVCVRLWGASRSNGGRRLARRARIRSLPQGGSGPWLSRGFDR